MSMLENIQTILGEIEAAKQRTGRTEKVTLIGVTKNNPVEAVVEAASYGITVVGENRVQEAKDKIAAYTGKPISWQLIGHLQQNKAKYAVQLFDMIHSVDSERILVEIDRCAERYAKVQDILLQINVAEEESKFGMKVEELPHMLELVQQLPHVRLRGLMCIAPNYENVEDVRPIFRIMRALFEEVKGKFPTGQIQYLSMGMTHDYTIAVEEGATMVRVGTAIFGARQY